MNSNDQRIEVTILGSGTSAGVPMIGCDCAVCTSLDPHDKRSRPSIFVRAGKVRILVDTSPELRMQCLEHGIGAVDAVLFTHDHADHILGFDDLRRFNWTTGRPVACYGTRNTLDGLKRMFAYAFDHGNDSPHTRPEAELHTIDSAPFTVLGEMIMPIPVMHGPLPVLGFRFGNFAYCTDCSHIPDESRRLLKGLDVLVLDAVRHKPHATHFNIDQAIEVARDVGAKQTYFTHIAHVLGHEQTNAELPDGFALAYDGLRISTTGGARTG